ncbi:uncharacterized protein BX663DRAFT_513878 [Cokeromyces recurvatus]|uniref:uncharacterized protein n=1 Tax=Cokeromyces recurvatus TaxID=90255 RepID=UPI00221F00C4|nr:uncharacterized protein BX663DRAFT_513878 [Cokeromyces recurvatus]KAI7901738.1 hypothetical protein BX663DRAFT_513878 [Cokeromyces recurvatus]
MSSEEKSIDKRESVTKEENEQPKLTKERERSPFSEDEDEELDEFGRVKRRRQKFKSERSEELDYDDRSDSDRDRKEDRYYHRRHRRRSSSGSRSPRRYYRRRYSDSDSDYERHHSSSKHRHYRSSHRHHSDRSYSSRSNKGGDVYTEAAQYIDTEFYPTKIYIGDIENVTESQIESIFSRFGPLESVKLVEGKDYGFVTYEKKESALAAIQNMNGALLGSKHIKVNRAKIPERNKIGFGNIPWQDEDGLMAKEAASYHSYNRRRSSTLMILDNLKDENQTSLELPIPRRALTSYDDL